ncbi:MAG: hypothetical protein CM1200mP27_07060 [Chloroflexota bacterium]|nr:MAG: hypothetical protein CM1200mP27_07060 [Chloroflexota bacterium]
MSTVKAILASASANQDAVDRPAKVVEEMSNRAGTKGQISLDFSLVRDLAYYNGVIFEVSHSRWPGTLGGGGRYDSFPGRSALLTLFQR